MFIFYDFFLNRHELLQKSKLRITEDGLNSLNYQILFIKHKKLYTKVLVYYNETEIYP